MVPTQPRPRPQFFTDAERGEFKPAAIQPHQKAAVLFVVAKALEKELSTQYDVTLTMRDTGGFTLTVDMPAAETRDDVKVLGDAEQGQH